MIIHCNIHLTGRVQKVGFRYYTQKTAISLGLCGYVTNQRDGSVYIEAEGNEAVMATFCDWCRKGPPLAEVTTINISDGPVKGFNSFEIEN